MESLRLRIKISALWIFMAVAMSAHVVLMNKQRMMQPDLLEEAIAEAEVMGPGMWVMPALFWLIPLIMAVLSLSLKDSANRLANVVLGIVFTIVNVYHFFQCGVPLRETVLEPTLHHILLVGSTVVVTALIAWYAWKWPKPEAES